jgi:aryl-alcohol dehydrogenase-like predicted oxidoreductase
MDGTAIGAAPPGRTALGELGPVGFGCYRISTVAPHFAAIRHALDLGCNLFDTASNYSGGKSETALGEVLRERDGLRPFIVTKAGYVEESDENLLSKGGAGSAAAELIVTTDGTRHCIHPDFLAAKLAQSTSRLGASPDAFLLHNPDHYFHREGGCADEEELYRRIDRAFAFLEAQVARGAIRCYGVSANALGNAGQPHQVDFGRLVEAARRAAPANHFRIVQFPFNFYERAAASRSDGPSLIEAARAAGIITLGNRPLNALTPAGVRRIATYEHMVDDDPEASAAAIAALRHRLVSRLAAELSDEEIERIPAIQFLTSVWRDCKDVEFVEYLFLHYVDPLAETLFRDRQKQAFEQVKVAARIAAMRQALRRLTEDGAALRAQLVAQGQLPSVDGAPLAVAACREYLRLGIDHVLVGIRRRIYVDDFQDYFAAPHRPLAAAAIA